MSATIVINNSNIAYNTLEYKRFEHRDHVYQIPDTYIGSVEKTPRVERVLNFDDETPKFVNQEIIFPEGIERIFLEILYNAGDNVQQSREAGISIGEIHINMNDKLISIRNNGKSIPIAIHPEENIYIPEMIFGVLLTSINYDQTKKRKVGGRNGYGAKICNIFSKQFTVQVGDPSTELSYEQTWSNNMKNKT